MKGLYKNIATVTESTAEKLNFAFFPININSCFTPINLGCIARFILKGHINFFLAVPLGACCVIGNIVGSRMAMRIGPDLIRRFLAFSLVLLFVSLVWKFWFAG